MVSDLLRRGDTQEEDPLGPCSFVDNRKDQNSVEGALVSWNHGGGQGISGAKAVVDPLTSPSEEGAKVFINPNVLSLQACLGSIGQGIPLQPGNSVAHCLSSGTAVVPKCVWGYHGLNPWPSGDVVSCQSLNQGGVGDVFEWGSLSQSMADACVEYCSSLWDFCEDQAVIYQGDKARIPNHGDSEEVFQCSMGESVKLGHRRQMALVEWSEQGLVEPPIVAVSK